MAKNGKRIGKACRIGASNSSVCREYKYECEKCTSVLSCYFVKPRFVEERFLHNIKVSDRLY